MKIIKKKNLTDDQAISDVVNEVNILKVLKGKPHVVEVFGVYEDHDSVYIVLECALQFLFQPKHWFGHPENHVPGVSSAGQAIFFYDAGSFWCDFVFGGGKRFTPETFHL